MTLTGAFRTYLQEHFPTAPVGLRWIPIRCIACQKPKMYVNLQSGRHHCFVCHHAGSTALDFVQDHLGVDPKVALQILRGTGESLTLAFREAFRGVQKAAGTSLTGLPLEYQPLWPREALAGSYFAEIAWEYLLKRGLSESDVILHQLGICLEGKYAGRIIIPILREREPVYFVARKCWGPGKRYLSASLEEAKVHPSQVLFNWDSASQGETLKITEGVFDAMTLGPEAVALLGTQLHGPQQRLIASQGFQRIEIWLDGDQVGQGHAAKLGHACQSFCGEVQIMQLDAKDDPSSAKGVALSSLSTSLEHYVSSVMI